MMFDIIEKYKGGFNPLLILNTNYIPAVLIEQVKRIN
jgi:hypothetical protein